MNDQAALVALLREELSYFVWKSFQTILPGTPYHRNWHIDAICHQLMRVQAGEVTRLLVNQPPRSLKSITATIAYVAWRLGCDPTQRIIVVSYSNELAAELHRQFRMVVDSSWYKVIFPTMKLAKDSGTELVTTLGGGRYATSIGGTLTGRGADLIVIDDPLKADDAMSEVVRQRVIEWYGGSLVSRLNDKVRGAIVVVMQRLHEDDLAGHLIAQGGWEHLDLPAISTDERAIPLGNGKFKSRQAGEVLHPEREGQGILDQIKSEIGSIRFSAQYQQRPIPLEGALIKRSWLRSYEHAPSQGQIVQSWDLASSIGKTSDWSVCTTWRKKGRDYYLLNVWRGRLEYPQLKRQLIALAKLHKPNRILLERAGPGLHLLQEFRANPVAGIPTPIGILPEGDKLTRMEAQSARFEAGQVFFPKDAQWLSDLLLEILAFPSARHDDQTDSISQFLNWAEADRYVPGNICGPIIIHRWTK